LKENGSGNINFGQKKVQSKECYREKEKNHIIINGSLLQGDIKEEQIKEIQIKKVEIKLLFFTDDMIIFV
jgi:hypothetical protein